MSKSLQEHKTISSKQIVEQFYKIVDGTTDTYECICGNRRKRKPNTGWMNLIGHIKSQHKEQYETLSVTTVDKSSQKLLTDFIPSVTSDKAKTIFGWIE